uniref:GTPase IMAP family member 4-like isoform X3 n=1 Tax=Crassostrea virginica TaxID=6565 RepID=A0A8B8CID4_CRAVI|nr:GTPase IMAP family member 4-like isoform X3 [Crassostrea virginica]
MAHCDDVNPIWDPNASKYKRCYKDISHSKDSDYDNDQERIQTEEKEDSANGSRTMCSDRCLPNMLANVNSDFTDFGGTLSTCVTKTSPNLCIPDVSVYTSSDCTNITGMTDTSMAQCVKFFYDKDDKDAENDNEWICICATKNFSKQCTSCGKRKKRPDNDKVDVEDLGDDDEEEEFRMLIAGIRGVGKSALANSIAGSEIQDSKADFGTVTKKAAKIKRKLNDRSLIYFDTPGLSKDMDKEKVVKEYDKCLVKAAPGLHAMLIVQKATTFTDDNHNFLETFTELFGENSWKFVLFVFTHVDELDEDLKVQLENGDKRLHDWLKKCDGRYIGINNMMKGRENQQQILRLLSAVDSLVKKNNEEIYTNEEFQKIYEAMKKAAQSRNVTVQYVREHYADNIQEIGTAFAAEIFNACRPS